MLTFEKLVEEFRELGVMEGDALFIHSSYKAFGGVEGGPQTLIDALLDSQVVTRRQIGEADVRLMKCNDVFRVAVKAMKEHQGPGLTYLLESPERARDWIPPMKPISSLKDVLAEIMPLHRTLASDGTDTALQIIGSYFPENACYEIETYEPLKPVWTWYVPKRYVVHEAYLETEAGKRIVDFKDDPLHIVSYSLPIDGSLTWADLSSASAAPNSGKAGSPRSSPTTSACSTVPVSMCPASPSAVFPIPNTTPPKII